MSNDGKKFSISPGHPWNIVEAGHGLAASVFFYGRDNEESCRTREVVQARAALIEEALNVHAETGLTPSQLVEMLKTLRAVMRSRHDWIDHKGDETVPEEHDSDDCEKCGWAVLLDETKAVGE